jgi:hypothetical protein
MPRTEEFREGAPQGLPPTYPGMPATQPLDPVTGGAPPAPPAVTARPRQSGWQQAHAEMFAATESHGPPWRPGPAPERQAAAPPPTGKLVVLSGGLGPWRQGEVIEAKWLDQGFPGADLQRLYDVEAVRPADEREAAQERVTLPGTAGATPLELQLADRDRRLGEQAQEVVRLRDELRAAKQQGPGQPQAPGPQGVDPGLIAEKDKVIKDLQRQLEEARGQQAQAEEGRGRKGK